MLKSCNHKRNVVYIVKYTIVQTKYYTTRSNMM